MLRLSGEIGRPVQAADGQRLGTVVDISVAIGERRPAVVHVAVGNRRRISRMVDVAALSPLGSSPLILSGPAPAEIARGESPPLAADEVLLVRDVLDTQVVDCVEHRIERVGDVLVAPTADGGTEVVAVDIGFGALLRRLGLRRSAERFGSEGIEWNALHLTSERGHRVQVSTPAAALHRLDAQELAALMAQLSTGHAADLAAAVEPSIAAAALAVSHPDVGARVTLALDQSVAEPLLAELPAATAADLRALRKDRVVRRRFARHRGWHRTLPRTPDGGLQP